MTESQKGPFYTRRDDALIARVRSIKEMGGEPLPWRPFRCPGRPRMRKSA